MAWERKDPKSDLIVYRYTPGYLGMNFANNT